MKISLLIIGLLLTITTATFAQKPFSIGCETSSAYPKGMTADLGIVIYSGDAETVWNALRLANLSQTKGDTVIIFLLGKAIDVFLKDSCAFDVRGLSISFVAQGGNILACGTCVRLRETDEVKMCTISSLNDLYAIVNRSRKVLTF